MKLLAFFLAVFVLLLSAVPCCLLEECEGEEEQEKIAVEKQAPMECEASCSPFLTCGSCTGFVVNSEFYNLAAGSFNSNVTPTHYQPRVTGEIIQAIWQPPRVG